MRDYVDCENLMKLASYHPNLMRKGFSEDMAQEARMKFKINKVSTLLLYTGRPG